MRVDVGDCQDKRNCMEGVLAGSPSMAFQTCKTTQVRGQYFDMCLSVLYIDQYLKDGVARAQVVPLPLTLSCSAVFPDCLPERRGVFGGKTLHDISNMGDRDAVTPIFPYVGPYSVNGIISDGRCCSTKGSSITFDLLDLLLDVDVVTIE